MAVQFLRTDTEEGEELVTLLSIYLSYLPLSHLLNMHFCTALLPISSAIFGVSERHRCHFYFFFLYP